jgi:hypothetical protein
VILGKVGDFSHRKCITLKIPDAHCRNILSAVPEEMLLKQGKDKPQSA